MKKCLLILLCLLSLAAVWWLWPHGGDTSSPGRNAVTTHGDGGVAATPAAATNAPKKISSLNLTNPLAFRLTNTALPLRELALKPHAILLQNALVDTDARLDLAIPAHLKSTGQPGAYLVQARGQLNAAFRRLITSAGAQVVSYIPNNAYLVHATATEADLLSASPLVQVVLPFEPYYKLQPSLLGLAVNEQPLPPGTALNLGLFASDATAEAQVQKSGATIIGRDRSAFGPVLRVTPPANWTALAQLPGVQAVEPAFRREMANDLSRVTLGVSPDTTSGSTNDWLGLTGLNVLVAVNDTGIDATNNPDLAGRVSGFNPGDTMDVNGHGTHVAGIIASSGAHSLTPTDVGKFAEGSVTNADFRGKAPAANLFSLNYRNSDYVLQTNAAVIGALISNNSWDNGDAAYDLAASSYDAATRDALPFTTGSQPVLFVFAAGNAGGGDSSGGGGASDTVMSPGTAKNVITVGALEQLRNITNIVTVLNDDGTTNSQNAYWQADTDSGIQVAAFSSRGNVGVGTEGSFGRFKPDVVAPGTFVVSTRSSQWDTNSYFNPIDVSTIPYTGQQVLVGGQNRYSVFVPGNAVGVTISITANASSPNPFPTNLPIYVKQSGFPGTNSGSYDFMTAKDGVAIPPDGGAGYLQQVQNNGFDFVIANSTNVPVNYDVTVAVYTTNYVGDLYAVLEGMDDAIGPYYRYETGTSMSAAAVSGVLALVQDYFTNKLHTLPSPALLKAMLINGARTVGGYSYAVTNGVNSQGWGLPNISCMLPLTSTNLSIGTNSPLVFVDQNPLTALATGDSHTYIVNLNTNSSAQSLNLQATLVWTDPPGDPAAAIKLVNGLELVVTNLDTGDVYFGNDISQSGFNQPWDTNGPPNLDTINNVENVFLQAPLAGRYSVTVVGRSVNVNAVTAQTNNTVQDFALVVTVGEGEAPQAISSVTDAGAVVNPTGSQDITFVTSTNSPLFHQLVGENTPLLGTNSLPIGTNTVWGSSGVVTLGMTNQWHFYVVTNNAFDPVANSTPTNAAFITFNSDTLAIPRMGTLASSAANATRPEADIDVYVSTDPSLTNLNPAVISNCLAGTVTATANSFGASVGRGGTEFVTFANSRPGQVYYVGVKSEDHMAAEYAFLAVFTSVPFSTLDKNGNQIVNGMLLPMAIPDGSPDHPGLASVFALAIYPMTIGQVIVTNRIDHQNYGDLYGSLLYNNNSVVLNNHVGLHNTFSNTAVATRVYDDSRNPIAGSTNSDGPGRLTDFRGKATPGLWLLGEEDNSPGSTGQVSVLTLKIQPHRNLTGGAVTVTVPAHGWFIDYVDVPPGYTNLTFFATNLPPTSIPRPIQMYEKIGNEPTLTDYDQEADLTNCITGNYPTGVDPGNSISVGPPLNMGRYFIGLYNPSDKDVTVLLSATLGFGSGADNNFSFASDGPTALQDDAVSSSGIVVPNTVTQLVASVSVGMVVNSPRISDYTFTLVSPTGQRVLLMENRGGTDTNGAGAVFVYTNVINSTASGGAAANTNRLAVPNVGITVPIKYDFYTVVDEMTIYGGTNPATFYLGSPDFIFDTGFTNNPTGPTTINVTVPPGYTNITIIMNQFGNPYAVGGDAWTYTAGAPMTNYEYMVFTDDTNLSNVPIKFAQPPFSLEGSSSNFTLCDFERATNGLYHGPTNISDAFGGWTVPTNLVTVSTVFDLTNQVFVQVTNVAVLTNNQVSVVADPSDSIGDSVGTNLLALAYGTITRNVATVPGRIYNVRFWFRGPGINGWWRGEGDALDSSDPERNANNGRLVGRFNFPAGEVGQAFGFEDSGEQFEFAGTNTYVQIPQSTSLDVGQGGGFTVEGWINPTNLLRPQPLVEWLAKVPTNTPPDTNFNRLAGPYFNPATGHYYYLLGATNWPVSERWATNLGGHLATVNTANEQNWIFDNFASLGDVNRNLWIGLTNNLPTVPATFGWSSGLTNIAYTNWLSGQPTNSDGTRNYTFILGVTNSPSGLWVCADTNGFTQTAPTLTNIVYGVVEVDQIQTNGVQFWVSATNSLPGGTNLLVAGSGGLYANLIDTSNVWHEIWSAPGLLASNVFSHVALTFDTNSGLAKLFLNGTNVATTNLFMTTGSFKSFVPKTGGDLLLGRDMTPYTNNYFGGRMDEMSIYSRALSDAEIAGIWRVSATATNGLTGKFDPTVVPEPGLAEATVVFGSTSNLIFGVNNQWEVNSYTFTATSNTMPLRITGLQPGILLDDFSVSQAPLTNTYYLPEQSLNDALVGNSASGTWTMQIWDNRVGAYVTNNDLVSWQLNFILQSNALVAAALAPQTPTPSTVGPGQTVYYEVDVPAWAKWATNVLVSSTLPVNLFFNPTNLPTGANPGDLTLFTGTSGVGSPVIAVNQPFPLTAANQAGSTYYLGVSNSTAHAASIVLEVDYDIMALTNGVPFTNTLATNDSVRYFSFVVTSNAYAATFQLLQLSGNADLVLRKGVPLPNLTNTDYGSFNAGSADENIFVLTNASYSPVPLSAGTWYLGVIKRDSGAVNYTVLAKELDLTNGTSPTIIDLTNAVPFNFNAGPGAALTNFFRFSLTNNPALTNAPGVRFALYNLSGNGDLTVQTNALPLAPPFFESSQNVGRNPEMIWVYTNGALTNLAANWYLGVPNHELTNISYTIVAMIDTNGYFPAFPGAEGTGGGAFGGGRLGYSNTVYHVFNLNDSGVGSLRDAVSSTNRTVVFDVSGTIWLQSRLVITNSFLTLAGQTAPGDGITVAGWETSVTNAHDVIIRYLRFRPGDTNGFDALRFITVSNVIVDHITATWAPRQVLSAIDSTNLTVQWSVMAEQLYSDPINGQFDGSQLRAGNGALSFHHNLYADNNAGSPHLQDDVSLDFVNNVIYNWGTNSGSSFFNPTNNPNGFTNRLNYTCNYLIAGSNSFQPWIAFHSDTTNTWIFETNNFIETNFDGVHLNGGDTHWLMFTNQYTEFGQPFPTVPVATDEAFKAYERVLAFAGTSLLLRDSADTNLVAGVRQQNGQIITSQNQVGGWPVLNTVQQPLDSDQDGIPDYWEITFGQNPTNASDYLPSTHSPGYTDLEEYLNWLAVPHALTVTNTSVAVDLYKLSGNSGHLAFFLANAVNGTVYLTNVLGSVTNAGPWSNSFAIFTPTNTSPAFSGYASFDYYVTNTDTMAYFGPVTVSVVVSATNITMSPTIIDLTNGIPLAFTAGPGAARTNFFRYTTTNSPAGIAFELYALSGNGDLVLQTNSLPVAPNYLLTSTQLGTNSEIIYVQTNSALTNVGGTFFPNLNNIQWYLGVPNNETNLITYIILAREIPTGPTIIDLTNNVPVLFTAGPGPALTNFFRFVTTNSPGAIQFRLYGQSGNGDLVLQTNALPFAPIYYASSQQPGNFPESILVTTNGAQTNLNNVLWYLGVPNNDPAMISYTIVATEIGAAPIELTNAVPVTNSVPSGGTQFYLVNVPINADFATNLLLFTTNGLPLNVWFSTNVPPTFAGPNDSLLITNATNGISVLGTNSNPPLVPGSFYYLGVQNTNVTPVTYGIEVIFHLLQFVPYATSEPATLVTGTSAQLNGMATANTLPGTAWFEYGPSAGYGTNTPPVALTNGYNVVFLTNAIAGLLPNQPYHFRLVVSNAYYVTYGFDQILDQANVVAWGANFIGQTTLPGRQTNMVAIAAGYDFSLDLSRNGTVATWGDNNFGQTNVPASLTNVVAVAGGWQDCLALRSDRTLTVWGNSLFGQTNVIGLSNVIAAAYGHDGNFWMALNADGTVKVRGYDGSGQTNVPAGLSNVVAVAGGSLHCLALNNDGTVTAWGYNGDGETSFPAGLTNVVAIAAGDYHSLALKADGTVVAWGLDNDGQTNVPAGLSNVVAVAGGGYHSLALKKDGTVVGWGYDGDGEATMPAGLTNVVAIAAGGFHSLALTSLSNLGHSPPFWPTNLPSQTVLELSNLTFNVAASNTNNPPDTMTYRLTTNAPAGMTINTNTGDVSWTPTEAQGPGIYSNITVIATANGLPPLSGTNSFTVTVLEVNTAPFWPANVQTNFVINALNTLIVSDTATDTDIPVNPLFYKLILPPGGTNATISTNTGVFTWTPSLAQTSAIPYIFTVIVTDTNAYALTNQSLSNTNSFTVLVLPPLAPTNGAPQTNVLAGNSVEFYLVNVPTNADFATNTLLFATPAGVNVWFTTNAPPSVGATNDSLLITNSTGGSAVIGTNTAPLFVPGALYWLGLQNTNSFAVTNALEVDFHFVVAVTNASGPFAISSIVQTNGGFLLTWFAPSSDLFRVQWTPSLAPTNWITFTNIIGYNTNAFTSPTNTQFNFFDDGVLYPFGPTRFYRLLLVTNAPNTAPVFTLNGAQFFVTPNSTNTVTNSATDGESPPQTLTYALVGAPGWVALNTNSGVITLTPTLAQAGMTNTIKTIVTDSGTPPLSATNTIFVIVNPLPVLGSVTFGTNGMTLQWSGWTNEQFEVQWATNLPPNWMLFSNGVSPLIITSTNGQFTFVDTNAPFLTKFYQLILLP